MPFQLPSRDDLHDQFIEQHEFALPELDASRGSDPYRLGRVVSGVAWSILAKGIGIERNLLPDQADEATLQRWAKFLDVPRESAAPSQGAVALRVSGTVGAPVPALAELAANDGTLFRVATAAVVGGGGTIDVDVAAITKGVIGNKQSGETLTFTTPPAQLQAEAVLVANLTGGIDVEDLERWRARIMDGIANPPEGGAVHDYVTWARRASAAVKDVYVWRHRRGRGTLDIAVLQDGSGDDRIIVDTSPITALIDELRPATVKDFLLLTAVGNHQAVTLHLSIDETRFGWDWSDGGVGTAVTAENGAAHQMTVAGLSAAVVVGKRIQVLGEQRKVTARAGDVLTLDSWFTFNPLGELVRAGGDLVEPVQAAIRAEFNRVGPARGNYAALAWRDTIKLVHLIAAVEAVDGVEDFTMPAPGANLTPSDNRDDKAYLLVPGVISVFKA